MQKSLRDRVHKSPDDANDHDEDEPLQAVQDPDPTVASTVPVDQYLKRRRKHAAWNLCRHQNPPRSCLFPEQNCWLTTFWLASAIYRRVRANLLPRASPAS